jgi:hypothetical protein
MLASVLIAAGCSTGNEFGAQPRFTADGGIEAGVDPLSRGKRHFANGNFGLAIEAFEEAREIAPGSINVMNALAVAYEEIGRPDLADSYFLEALDAEPDSAQTYNNWAMAQLSRGNAVKAQELLAEAARLTPGDEVVISNMARVATATALPAADQAVIMPLATGSLSAIAAELQQPNDWGPSIRAVAPHVHVLQTLRPGAVAATAQGDALPMVLYPQTAAVDILPMPDVTEMPPSPPAVPVVPVFAAMLDASDPNDAGIHPLLAGRLTSAVPVGSRYPDNGDLHGAQTLLAQAATDMPGEAPHFYERDGSPDGPEVAVRADPVLIRPFQDMPQDVELAAMTFLPIGPEPDDADSAAVRVVTAARTIELEPAVASRAEPIAIGVWSTPPVAASESMPEPLQVLPATASSPAATGTIVVPYEGQSAASAEADEAGLVVVPYGAQSAAVPSDPADHTQPAAPPVAKPDMPAAEAALPLDSAADAPVNTESEPEAVTPQAHDVGAVGPGVTALAAVPPLFTFADAIRVAVSPEPVRDSLSIHPDASTRMPLVIAVLAASEAMAPQSPDADTRSVEPSRSPLAAAGRTPTVAAMIAMWKTGETDDGHEDDLEAAR